ncbi:DUF6522 family protein [Luteimonas sp. TWI1416]|uniref:DUF6522 family protein n=1 Tax=unclassified Luteimonas TaxID=2629088 RepID=UPI003207E2E9
MSEALTIAAPRRRQPALEVDGALVAARLGLAGDAFRQLMTDGKVSVLCERGIGEDAGRYRATFYYAGRRARLLLDASGRLLEATGEALARPGPAAS